MDRICRLCLSVSVKLTCELDKETKLLDALSCLNIQINVNKLLPTFVCVKCISTLHTLVNYRETVLINQSKLIGLLNNTKHLEHFYQSLKQSKHSTNTIINETDTDSKDNLCNEIVNYEPLCLINISEGNKNELNKLEQECDDNLSKEKSINRERKLKYHVNKLSKEPETTSHVIESHIDNYEIKIDPENNETEVNDFEDISIPVQINKSRFEESKCLTCLICLPSRKELIKHYKLAHISIDEKNSEASTEQNNLKNDNIENEYDKRHKSQNYSDESRKLYVCKICGRTFPNVYGIVRHGRAHGDTSIYCSHGCGYSTVYRGALRDHERRHEKDYKYKCSTCGTGFHVKTWHDQHQNIHKNIKPFVCDLCGLAFHMDRYLKNHRATVHSEVIEGEKRFMCPHCETTFNNIKKYKKHLEEHEGKKRFLCDICGKECSSGEQLKYHKNTHLGIKPYTCSICNKSFSKKYNLTVHGRAHAGLKHLCTACGNHFAQRSTLLRHVRKCHPEIKRHNNESIENIEVQEK